MSGKNVLEFVNLPTTILLSAVVTVTYSNATTSNATITVTCGGATVTPASRTVAPGDGSVSFTVTHTAPGVGHMLNAKLTQNGSDLFDTTATVSVGNAGPGSG